MARIQGSKVTNKLKEAKWQDFALFDCPIATLLPCSLAPFYRLIVTLLPSVLATLLPSVLATLLPSN